MVEVLALWIELTLLSATSNLFVAVVSDRSKEIGHRYSIQIH